MQVEVDADAIKMKKLRLFFSFLVLVETRSVIPKLIKLSGILLKPVPNLIKSIHAWAPASSGLITTHALSGATTEVKSSLGNQINLKAGEELDYQFYTSRYSAGSFKIEGGSRRTYDKLGFGAAEKFPVRYPNQGTIQSKSLDLGIPDILVAVLLLSLSIWL